jgi:hypothetical protein
MKKGVKLLSGMFVAVAVTFVFAASSFAQFTCAKMEPTLINTNSVWMKNVSGAACGTLANNTARYFLLNPANQDPLLAVLLTALSLNKTVWVHAAADVASGGVADVIAIAK